MLISGAAALTLLGSAVSANDALPAVQVGCDNTGDYLIAPLYYAIGPWQTDLKVVNTNPNRAIVAKVVIREGTDCSEILDFAIYLTPGDVWTGTIYDDNGVIKVKSDDDSFIIGGKQGSAVGSIGVHPRKEGHKNNTMGYVEIFGMASYDPDLLDDGKANGSWSVCDPLDKLTFYHKVKNGNDLVLDFGAADVSNDDLTGRVTITTTATDVNSMRYMTLNMTAFENFSTEPKYKGAIGGETKLPNMTNKGYRVLPELDAALAKAKVNVLYEGDGDSLYPIRAHFTVPTKKYWYESGAGMPTAYQISDIYGDGLAKTAPSEYYYSVNPTGNEIAVRDNSENCNKCRKQTEISGVKHESCEIKIHPEVAFFDNDSDVVKELAFASGGWASIDLTNNIYVGRVAGSTVGFSGMPGIPTSFIAKGYKINGGDFYLNNWLYDSYKAATIKANVE
jgi:hypothetical protein